MILLDFVKRIRHGLEVNDMCESKKTGPENKEKPGCGGTELSAPDPAGIDGAEERDTVKVENPKNKETAERSRAKLTEEDLAKVAGGGEWDDVPKTDEHNYDPDTINNA